MNAYQQIHQATLDALGHPTRRRIYELLAERPRSVGELAEEMPVSRPAVSQHLRVLADTGLVTYRREGTRHVYRPDPAGLGPLREWIESMWDDVLAAYAGERPDECPKGGER